MKVRETGIIPITDEWMTRFWITLEQAVEFVIRCFEIMQGGEIFVPKIPSMKIVDLATAIAPECEFKVIGIRPGEKLHEVMVPEDDARKTLEYDNFYLIQPEFTGWGNGVWKGGRRVPDGFKYSSDTNTRWLTVRELREMTGIEKQESTMEHNGEPEFEAHADL